MAGDLEYLEQVFDRPHANAELFDRSFTVVRGAGLPQRTVGENTKSVSVGSKSSVDDPPGTNS